MIVTLHTLRTFADLHNSLLLTYSTTQLLNYLTTQRLNNSTTLFKSSGVSTGNDS